MQNLAAVASVMFCVPISLLWNLCWTWKNPTTFPEEPVVLLACALSLITGVLHYSTGQHRLLYFSVVATTAAAVLLNIPPQCVGTTVSWIMCAAAFAAIARNMPVLDVKAQYLQCTFACLAHFAGLLAFIAMGNCACSSGSGSPIPMGENTCHGIYA